ncbi:MAG: hypothetical protein AVDCRST_MAG10-412 [uncultured Acidimicrobiales bacterium]|uniref:Uncharacterized protein n=1 Tax=uncultured Acidimicrobiales bacterium TaxID=310071 RepID=A0A6J4HAL1_9ACTN|nr:MAG: hypothetical protein AVDCRST_MAG10-412 [uncultured Acidimicrobiales bacterium]
MPIRRVLFWVLSLGLLFLGTGFTNGASADTGCGEDCAPEPLSSYFTELADATLVYYPPNPATEQLVSRVLRARDALYPPNPARPPAPIRSFALLNSYSYEVEALAGTPNGATETGTALLLGEAYELQGLIAAAYPSSHFPPSAFHPPNPA